MAGISWESLRMLAGQTEVGKNVKKAQNPRLGRGGQPASRLWAEGANTGSGEEEVRAAWPRVETLLSKWSFLRLQGEGSKPLEKRLRVKMETWAGGWMGGLDSS